MELFLLLATIGLIGGVLAGWIGLGGGIIVAPLLLYAPVAAGFEPFDMKEVARLTIVLSLISTATAGVIHDRARQVNRRLVVWAGAVILGSSLIGAFCSECGFVSCDVLHGMFATMALAAGVLLIVRPTTNESGDNDPTVRVEFSRPRATIVAAGVGFAGGMVGQSGAFLTIPLLIHVLKLPVRVAIGSSLGITFSAAVAGSAGKLIGGGPVSWPQVAALAVGSLLGSRLGAMIGHRQPPRNPARPP